MKKLNLFFLLFLSFGLFAKDELDLWPLKGKKAGEGILYKPQDYVEKEHNFGNLFLTAPEGTYIVAPCDGTIKFTCYSYRRTLKTMWSMGEPSIEGKTIEEADLEHRQHIAEKKGVEARNINYSLTIVKSRGDNYHIGGLVPVKFFKTGSKIKKGDIIGKIGYAYHKILEPTIVFSRSVRSKNAEPMKIFGLESTFIPPKVDKTDYKNKLHKVEKLLEDFDIFRTSLEEGNPGCYQYVSKQELDSLFEAQRALINKPMKGDAFKVILLPILHRIGDSHCSLYTNKYRSDNYIPTPILFSYVQSKLYASRVQEKYLKYLGKEVVELDGKKIPEIIKEISPLVTGFDGYIKAKVELELFSTFWLYHNVKYNKKNGSKLKVKFADGEELILTYQFPRAPYLPKRKYPKYKKYNLKMLDSTTAYIDINTFGLHQTDFDSIEVFIKKQVDSKIPNIIFDVRNNGGGNGMERIYSYLTDKKFQTSKYSMVNKKGVYDFFKYSNNRNGGQEDLFKNFEPQEGKKGFYSMNENFHTEPNNNIHYEGNVFVLTNARSISASTLFPSYIKHNKRGLVIGRETGTAMHSMNAVKFAFVNLHNTGYTLYMPLMKIVTYDKEDTNCEWGRGVIPDYNIELSLEEKLDTNDYVLDSALRIVKNYKPAVDSEQDNNILYLILVSLFLILFGVFYFRKK
jgi:C-terminal processing protease CtpA/Prc